MIEPPTPALEFLSRFTVALGPPIEVGAVQWGRRRVFPIVGGEFAGPRLRGEVVGGGADWQVVHADGSATIDTRYTLRLDTGAPVYLATSGSRHGPADVLAALAGGEEVDPSTYYFRLVLRFETADPAHAWLNQTVAVGSAVRRASSVIYDAYALR